MAVKLKQTLRLERTGLLVFMDSWATTIVNPPPVITELGGDL